MKTSKLVLSICTAIVLGLSINSTVMAAGQTSTTFKVATINVPLLVNESASVKALKKEQQTKIEELQKWLNTAKTDIDKQQTKEGKEALVKKYDATFAKKQEDIRKSYAEKIKKIESNISATISSVAKAQGYDMVLSNGVVLYGATDITQDVAKQVK